MMLYHALLTKLMEHKLLWCQIGNNHMFFFPFLWKLMDILHGLLLQFLFFLLQDYKR